MTTLYRICFTFSCFLLLNLNAFCAASQLTSTPVRSGLIPFEPVLNQGAPIVSVAIGNVVGRFVIDTGSDECIMSPEFAASLNIKRGFTVLNVDKLTIGVTTLLNVPFHERTPPFGGEQPVDGLIGGNVLSQTDLYIDFPHHLLALLPQHKVGKQELALLHMSDCNSIPIKDLIVDHVILNTDASDTVYYGDRDQYLHGELSVYSTAVSCSDGVDVGNGTVYIDTGQSYTILPSDVSNNLNLGSIGVTGVWTMTNGSERDDVSPIPTVTIGDLTWHGQSLAYPVEGKNIVSPLLGEDVLSKCIALFDFNDGILYLKPVLPPVKSGDITLYPSLIDPYRLALASDSWSFADASLATDGPYDFSDTPARIEGLEKELKGDDSDVDIYENIGTTLIADNQVQAAFPVLEKAVAILQRKRTASPKDAALYARLAIDLLADEDVDQAAQTASEAIAIDPTNPKVWDAQGEVLHAQSVKLMTGSYRTVSIAGELQEYHDLIAGLKANPPGPSDIATAMQLSVQARADFDKAVSLAPSDPAVYVLRRAFIIDDALGVQAPIQELKGVKINIASFVDTDQGLKDLNAAAQLSSNDPYTLMEIAFLNEQHGIAHSGAGIDLRPSELWNSLPRSNRTVIQSEIDSLNKLSKDKNPVLASRAMAAVGILQWRLLDDENAAALTFENAIMTDPECGDAWTEFSQILSNHDAYTMLAQLLNAIIKKRDSAQLELLLARTLEKQGDLAGAVAHAQLAQSMKPNSFQVNIALATFLMRSGPTDAVALAHAGDALKRASAAMGVNPSQATKNEYDLDHSIYLGLTGDPATAAQTLMDLMKRDLTNTRARDALAALLT